MYRIKIDRSRCIGCLMCVTSCCISHDTHDARNRVVIDSETKPAPIFCRHCDNPECAITCMTGAMYKDPDTGYVRYNRDQCAHCFMCVMGCPYGVLKPDAIHHVEVMKCDMCVHRSEDGMGNPMCVEKCPMHAITLVEVKK